MKPAIAETRATPIISGMISLRAGSSDGLNLDTVIASAAQTVKTVATTIEPTARRTFVFQAPVHNLNISDLLLVIY